MGNAKRRKAAGTYPASGSDTTTRKRLVALGTFYKNDVPEGFGLQCREPELAQQIADLMERVYRGFQRAPLSEQRRFLSSDLYGQLAEASRLHKIELKTAAETNRFVIYGACNVYIMEQEGILWPDEFNGSVFLYDVIK